MDPQRALTHVFEQSGKPAYSRRTSLIINSLGPIFLILGFIVAGYTLYLASYSASGYGPQFIIKDGNAGPSYVAPPAAVTLATATNAAIQNYTLRVGQGSCLTESTCVIPQMILPDPQLVPVGTIVTVRNGSVDTEAVTKNLSLVSYISPPQKVKVKIGGTGFDYIVRGDLKSYIVLDNGGPRWYHTGLPMEGWKFPAVVTDPI